MECVASTPESAPAARLGGLDALRGIAACVVAFGFHAQFMFVEGAIPKDMGGSVGQWLRAFGWTAVDLFFVLSGFVFAHVYIGRSGSQQISLGEFAIARIARLYPLHLATLLLCALAFAGNASIGIGAFAAHLVMAQALVMPTGHTFNGPSWSLSVEAICYCIFAAGLWGRRDRLLPVTAIAIAVGLAGTQFYTSDEGLNAPGAISRGLLGFFIGQALWRGHRLLARVPSSALAILALLGLIVDPAPFAVVLPLSLLTWPALVLLATRLPLMEARPLIWLGDRSYAIYLLHMPIIDMVYLLTRGGLIGSFVTVVAAHVALILVTLLLADISYRRFELPLRHKVRAAFTRRPDLLRA